MICLCFRVKWSPISLEMTYEFWIWWYLNSHEMPETDLLQSKISIILQVQNITLDRVTGSHSNPVHRVKLHSNSAPWMYIET